MQYDIYLVNLDPRFGSEPDKTRPCIIVSPYELNRYLQTVVIIPLTTTIREWPFRPIIRYEGKNVMPVLIKFELLIRIDSFRKKASSTSKKLKPLKM